MIIGLFGLSHDITKEQERLAYESGKEVAVAGEVLLTGATTGVPMAGARGASESGGTVIGISPAYNREDHEKNYSNSLENHTHIIYTGLGYAGRNLINVRTSDAAIIVAGHIGTLNEFTLSYVEKKPIGVLVGSGGVSDKIKDLIETLGSSGAPIVYDSNPKELVKKLIEVVK